MDGHYEEMMIDQTSEEQFLIETNHYRHPNNLKYNKYNNPWLLPNSKKRYSMVESVLKSKKGTIDVETVHQILSAEFPEGLCCHWYTDGFGTPC